jgi:hypothetical protein
MNGARRRPSKSIRVLGVFVNALGHVIASTGSPAGVTVPVRYHYQAIGVELREGAGRAVGQANAAGDDPEINSRQGGVDVSHSDQNGLFEEASTGKQSGSALGRVKAARQLDSVSGHQSFKNLREALELLQVADSVEVFALDGRADGGVVTVQPH